jgi:hypothetical protein
MIIYGANATLKLRRAEALAEVLEGFIFELYAPTMAIARLKSSEWALVAVMARPDERPVVLEAHIRQPSPEALSQAKAQIWAIHTDALVTQKVDKLFHHLITHFRP